MSKIDSSGTVSTVTPVRTPAAGGSEPALKGSRDVVALSQQARGEADQAKRPTFFEALLKNTGEIAKGVLALGGALAASGGVLVALYGLLGLGTVAGAPFFLAGGLGLLAVGALVVKALADAGALPNQGKGKG